MNPALATDETGNVYGEWTVISRAGFVHGSRQWRCRCSCGTERNVYGNMLRSGKSKSCGHKTVAGSPPRQRHCSVCGETGHRFESCPAKPAGMRRPPKRPTTQRARAEAAGREPPSETRPRAGREWNGHEMPVSGPRDAALRQIVRMQSDVAPRASRLVYVPEDSTPLTEILADWKDRYQLTADESEVLFVLATGALESHQLAAMADVTGDVIHMRGVAVAAKVGVRSVTHAALVLVREALMFATFDWDHRFSRREEDDHDD